MGLMSQKPHKPTRKIERIEARLNPEQKRRIQHAAGLRGDIHFRLHEFPVRIMPPFRPFSSTKSGR